MSTIAIARGRSTTTLVSFIVMLAAIGLIAGFGLARLQASGHTTAAAITAASVTAKEAFRIHVASERALVAPQVSAEESYRLQRASEQALVAPQVSAEESYRLQRASERGLVAP